MNMIAWALVAFAQAAQPTSTDVTGWQWDRDTPLCGLIQRIPQSGETLEIRRTPANDETEILITLSAKMRAHEGQFHDAVITTSSGSSAIGDLSLGADKYGQAKVHFVTPDPKFIDYLSTASALEISHDKVAPLKVAVTSSASAVAALHSCEDRKMLAWGINPVGWHSLRSHPFPLNHIRDRFSALDYPAEALAQHVEADVITELDVDTSGRVSKCRALNPGGYRGFEQAVCDVLKGAQFEAALDASGNRVPAPILFDIIFRIDD